MSKTIMFNISDNFETAIDKFLVDHQDLSRAALVRTALAGHIKYDLAKEPKTDRATKYATPELRAEAAKNRAKVRRQLVAKLLEAYEQEDNEGAIKALVATIKDSDLQEVEEEIAS